MTPERWQRIKAIFNDALERDPADRAAFVAQACGGDAELLGEVESLLATHESAGDALEKPAANIGARLLKEEEPNASPMVGQYVGPYRLLREIGWGGMGTIYEAVRDDEVFRKRVAIKIVRREMASQLVLDRFRHERQILAELDHPYIAALFDGGVTQDGRPYFAMEFVEGQPIDQYCASRKLAVNERIALFMRVCEAVQYAHRRLVVHRDLKPGNILVTESGQPKLLDFGIAKLLEQGETASNLTRAGDLLLTPDYASPEQVRGARITTAVDVYSLGVILYELLAGSRPHQLEGRPLHEIVRTITESDPVRPSAAIAQASEHASADGGSAQLRRKLAGDLDSIVLKAIRKEPDQRYVSVEQFREDLQRYADGHPVLARKASDFYRVRKFIRRHTAVVGTITLLILVLTGGIVGTMMQARRAEAERARAEARYDDLRGLTNSVLFEIHDSVADLPGATQVRSLLVKRGMEYLDRLSKQGEDDPSLQREIAGAHLRFGALQGNPTTANFGDRETARTSSTLALNIGERLLAANPNDREALRIVALAHEKLSDVESWEGNTSGGVSHARKALEAWRKLSEGRAGSAAAVLPLAISHVKLGDVLGSPMLPNRGDYSGAMAAYQTALRLLEALPPQEQANVGVRRYIALLHERIGDIHLFAKRYGDADAAFEQSLAVRNALAADHKTNRDVLRDLGVGHEKICSMYLSRGDGKGALPRCRQARDIYYDLYSADQRDAQALGTLAVGHLWVHRALAASGDLAGALAELDQSTRLFSQLREMQADSVSARRRYAYNLLFSSQLNLRMANAIGVPEQERSERRRRALAELTQGRTLLEKLQAEGAASVEDDKLIRATADALGAAE